VFAQPEETNASGSARGEFAPLEDEVRNQNGHKSDEKDLYREAGFAMAVPGWDGLQNAGANESKGNGVGADHPLTVLLNVPIACCKKRSHCGDDPRS
jgi:hypothetical protein